MTDPKPPTSPGLLIPRLVFSIVKSDNEIGELIFEATEPPLSFNAGSGIGEEDTNSLLELCRRLTPDHSALMSRRELRAVFLASIAPTITQLGFESREQVNVGFILGPNGLKILPDDEGDFDVSHLQDSLNTGFRVREAEILDSIRCALERDDRQEALRIFVEASNAGASILYRPKTFLEVSESIAVLPVDSKLEAAYWFAVLDFALSADDFEAMTRAHGMLTTAPAELVPASRLFGLRVGYAREQIKKKSFAAAKANLILALQLSAELGNPSWRAGVYEELARCSEIGSPARIENLERACDGFREGGELGHLTRCIAKKAQELRFANRARAIETLAAGIQWLEGAPGQTAVHRATLGADLGELQMEGGSATEARNTVRRALAELEAFDDVAAPEPRMRLYATASMLERSLGSAEDAARYRKLSDQVWERHNKATAALTSEMCNAITSNPASLGGLRRQVETSRNPVLVVRYWWSRARVERDVPHETKLSYLENALAACEQIRSPYMRRFEQAFIQCELGDVLTTAKNYSDAFPYFYNSLALFPSSEATLAALIKCQQESELWIESIPALELVRASLPDSLPVLYTLGRAYLKSANLKPANGSHAAVALTRALALAKSGSGFHSAVAVLLSEAHSLGYTGDRSPPPNQAANSSPATIEEFEEVLEEFSKHMSQIARMHLWAKAEGGKPRKWCVQPERYAGNLFEAFIHAKFRDRINVFKEVGRGAGRIDFLIMFSMSVRAVVELKMCGSPYGLKYVRKTVHRERPDRSIVNS